MDMFRRQDEPPRQAMPEAASAERYSSPRSRSLHAAADVPSPITVTVGVEQQFSGDGVPALTQTERSNRNARRAVSVLAALLLLLVVVPAILLITPNAFRAGYGVAPHTAIATVVSTAIPPVADSPTPTPTVGPGAAGVTNPAPHPTATPHAQPTATPRPQPTATLAPTATSLPTPTATPTPPPTATVNPYGAAATVSFTRTAQPINVSQTMTACAGCGISTAGGGTIPAQYVNPTVIYHPAQWGLTHNVVPASAATTTLTIYCPYSPDETVPYCSYSPGELIPSTDGYSCRLNLSNTVNIPDYQSQAIRCTLTIYGPACFQFVGSASADVTTEYPNCGGSNAVNDYIIPTDCLYWHNTGKSTQSEALTYVTQQVESQGMPTLIQEGSPALVGNYYCGDQNAGYHPPGAAVGGSWWSQYQSATDWRFTYDAGNAPTLQQQRIQAGIPSGFVLDAKSVSVCGAGSVQGGVDLANHRAPIACPASARALFDWSLSREQALAQAIAGKTVAEAQSILVNTFGITPGSVKITVKNGAARFPQDPAQIQFGIGDPS